MESRNRNLILSFPKSPITTPNQIYGLVSQVPADFDGAITVSLWRNGVTIPQDAELWLNAFYLVAADYRLAESPVVLSNIYSHDDVAAGISPQTAILVGQFRIGLLAHLGAKSGS